MVPVIRVCGRLLSFDPYHARCQTADDPAPGRDMASFFIARRRDFRIVQDDAAFSREGTSSARL